MLMRVDLDHAILAVARGLPTLTTMLPRRTLSALRFLLLASLAGGADVSMSSACVCEQSWGFGVRTRKGGVGVVSSVAHGQALAGTDKYTRMGLLLGDAAYV